MTSLLENYVGGKWVAGNGPGTALVDPITGNEIARVSSEGIDLEGGFAFARDVGQGLRARTYAERAGMLGEIAKLLSSKKDDYYAIATGNSGTTKPDSAIDIEGSSYTLSFYAKLGASLGSMLRDGESTSLAKDGSFASQHVLVPAHGLALFINAYNFPAWGLWEKAAPALLSGVPVVVKPATPTAWLTQRMVKDVVAAGILPEGALSIVCGSPAGLLDRVGAFDVVSFTGSASTAAKLRGHAAFVERSARINVEADSVNSAVLAPSATQATIDAFVSEVAREMTQKSGQKCTAIRRAFVPRAKYAEVAEAIKAKLAKVTVGNPRNESVRMGALVNRAQLETVRAGIAALQTEAKLVFGGETTLIDADAKVAACIGPQLFGDENGASRVVHELEVFGPVATLIGYEVASPTEAAESIAPRVARGGGSLVVSVFGDDDAELAKVALSLAPTHGRVHVVSSAVAKAHTGHGNVMPQSLHGGPGRAGGGEELGGLRALSFYHRRAAIQAPATTIAELK
jgi:3,4-dehydroadipyl-CoA semialdehyde dehydrogenase